MQEVAQSKPEKGEEEGRDTDDEEYSQKCRRLSLQESFSCSQLEDVGTRRKTIRAKTKNANKPGEEDAAACSSSQEAAAKEHAPKRSRGCFLSALMCRDSVHGESLARSPAGLWTPPQPATMQEEEEEQSAAAAADLEASIAECRSKIQCIAFHLDELDYAVDAHTMETAFSICTCAVMQQHGKEENVLFGWDDYPSKVLFSAACFTIACKFCQSSTKKQMEALSAWINSMNEGIGSSYYRVSHWRIMRKLFAAECSILKEMDWRLNFMVQPTSSSLLFLTGHVHRLQVLLFF